MNLNFKNVDSSIESFYKLLPYGNYFSETVYSLKIDYEEQEIIKKYLVDNDIITDYTDDKDGRYIMTPHGQEIFKDYGGIEKYNEHQKEKKEENLRLENIKNRKLESDAKLSEWQVKTFWWVFSFGIIGGIYAVISIVIALTGETTEQKIQRILESKLKAQPKIENTSIAPTSKKPETLKK
jgi:predicted transcriptional regulator